MIAGRDYTAATVGNDCGDELTFANAGVWTCDRPAGHRGPHAVLAVEGGPEEFSVDGVQLAWPRVNP